MRRIIFRLSLVLAMVLAFHVSRSEAAHVRVLILPFEMHGSEELDFSVLRQDVMETLAVGIDSLGGEVVGIERIKQMAAAGEAEGLDEAAAQRLGEEVGADFAVLGSVTMLGDTWNTDWRVLDVKMGTLLKLYFKSSETKRGLLKKVEEETPGVYDRMVASIASRPVVKKGIIDRIAVSGNRRVDAEAVLARVSSREGEPFDQDSVREDIVSIFNMGYFDDVEADLSESASGRELRFVVKERPFLKSFSVSGNSEVDSEKIKEVMTLKENTVLDRVLVKQNAEIIRMLYAAEGFYLATVETDFVYEGVDAVVTYRIVEGEEVRVKRITFIGNEKFSARELRKTMETKKKGLFSFITGSGKFDEFIFQQDLGRIMARYFDEGYVQADILEHSVQLSEDKKWFYIAIALTEGEQFTVGSVDVTGEFLTTREDVLKKLNIKSGEIFNRSKLSEGMDALTFMYGDEGYANADIVPSTSIDADKRTIGIAMNIVKNDPVYIERIDITGNAKTRDKVIRREFEVREGELYSSSGLLRSEGNLNRLGFFEEVTILETPGTKRDRVRLDTEVVERPTGSFTLGLGFSSVDKIVGTASIAQANFFGTGVKLDLSGTLSSTSSKYMFSVTEPWLFDKPLSAGVSAYNTTKEYPDFDLDKIGGGVNFGFPLHKRTTRAYISYKYEDVEITNVADTATTTIKEQEGTSQTSSVKLYIKHDSRDTPFFPRKGTFGSFTTEYAGGFLGGNTNFVKYETSVVQYFPLPWRSAFSIRGFIGYIHSFADKNVPVYERFYLGGINTIRGFKTREVGPKDPATGEFIGGTTAILSNAEILFPLFGQKNFRGLVFFDAGNAYAGSIEFDDVRTSAGLGLRWNSPMGPIRLELGFNLDPEDNEGDYEWDFAMGTAF